MRRLVVVGAGGFGREVFAVVAALASAHGGWDVEGFVDDAPSASNEARIGALGSQLLGTVADLALREDPFPAIVAVGSPTARAAVVSSLSSSGVHYLSVVHPAATIGPDIVPGEGFVAAAGARLSTNISIGRHVQVDQNATVGHDCVLDDYSRLNPQACVSGSVRIGAAATVGAAAVILPGVRVGASATVGAGAVVVGDVPPGAVVKGVPAR